MATTVSTRAPQRELTTFCYWDKPDTSPISGFLGHWRQHFPAFRVFGDDAVEALLAELAPDDVTLYHQISLPAARADVARLALLYRYGGLYVDCHYKIENAQALRRLMADLDRFELIVVEVNDFGDAPQFFPRLLFNGFLLCRPRLPLIRDILMQGLKNLHAQRAAEAATDTHIPYNLFTLAGPFTITASIVDMENTPHELHPDLRQSVKVIQEANSPVKPHLMGRNYNGPSNAQHWLERQKSERLFVT